MRIAILVLVVGMLGAAEARPAAELAASVLAARDDAADPVVQAMIAGLRSGAIRVDEAASLMAIRSGGAARPVPPAAVERVGVSGVDDAATVAAVGAVLDGTAPEPVPEASVAPAPAAAPANTADAMAAEPAELLASEPIDAGPVLGTVVHVKEPAAPTDPVLVMIEGETLTKDGAYSVVRAGLPTVEVLVLRVEGKLALAMELSATWRVDAVRPVSVGDQVYAKLVDNQAAPVPKPSPGTGVLDPEPGTASPAETAPAAPAEVDAEAAPAPAPVDQAAAPAQ